MDQSAHESPFSVSRGSHGQAFVFAVHNLNENARHRRLHFTDEEKQSSSEALIKQISDKSPLALLAEIDFAWEQDASTDARRTEIWKGPFGSFKLPKATIENADSPDVSAFIENFVNDHYDNIVNDEPALQLVPYAGSPYLDDLEDREILHFLGTRNPVSPIRSSVSSIHSTSVIVGPVGNACGQLINRNMVRSRDSVASPALQVSRGLPGSDMLKDAPALLRYYTDSVIPLMTPFKHGKTPWHILFLPVAKNTLASIAINGFSDDASLCAFYAILSLSAHHAQCDTYSQRWSDQTEMFKYLAEERRDLIRTKAYLRPKAFKYKVVLVAFLAMAQLSITNGTPERSDQDLLEAEIFIRLRGLTKPHKSRKVRLLHHCYAYMRIFHESLSRPRSSVGIRPPSQRVIEAGDRTVSGEDSPDFRLAAWENLDEKLLEVKSREQGENDLHLSMPGLWNSTLYPEIWGIPESWMILLSQTIRLGNEKDLTELAETGSTLSLGQFSKRAKALEQCILRWKGDPHDIRDTVGSSRQQSRTDLDILPLNKALDALHHALIIYFYRRVHDVDAKMLQMQVVRVKDSLFICRQHLNSGSKYLAGLIWPAFVAACEAIDVDLQKSFLEWFELCARHTGPSSLSNMRELVNDVWFQRRQLQDKAQTWLQIMRSRSIPR